ncbi:MAG TPA: DUF1318 domain-containing protein [Planctomycetota bacterium]|nr:DUF1318 domain-containing protein [Planctomycetota bacterium]
MALLAALFLSSAAASQQPPTPRDAKAELKDRMMARYPLLEQLRDAGRIGETRDGEVKVVKAADAGEKVNPKDPGKGTVGELVDAENKDRHSLYAVLANELKLTAAEVAQQNGLRNLNKAKPEHWIEVKGQWVQRKSIKTPGEQDK